MKATYVVAAGMVAFWSTSAGAQGNVNQGTASGITPGQSYCTISGGRFQYVQRSYGTIGGGIGNTVGGVNGTIAGGQRNHAGERAAVAGGMDNAADGGYAAVAGGRGNEITIYGPYACIAGGLDNYINGSLAAIGGGQGNMIGRDSDWSFIGGGELNLIGNVCRHSIINGGEGNEIVNQSQHAAILSGRRNLLGFDTDDSTIVSGMDNAIRGGEHTAILSGVGNVISNYTHYVSICGGLSNAVAPGVHASVVSGGEGNTLLQNAAWAGIGGGSANAAGGWASTVPGGMACRATGDYSLAAGRQARALHGGSFVWADSSGTPIASTSNNQFVARAAGGFLLYTDAAGSIGVSLDPNDTAWNVACDRAIKENFRDVDCKAVLNRLADMPLQEWNVIGADPSVRHVGPVAQDFHSAFGLGSSERKISTVDADGIAMAAIKGLNEIVAEKDTEIADLKSRVASLETRLADVLQRLE